MAKPFLLVLGDVLLLTFVFILNWSTVLVILSYLYDIFTSEETMNWKEYIHENLLFHFRHENPRRITQGRWLGTGKDKYKGRLNYSYKQ